MPKVDPKGSFVRWQSITIGQLTYAINLILSFSVATLGFQVTLLLSDKFNPVSWQKCAFSLSLALLAASLVFGVWVVINRLRDFRTTMKAAREREKLERKGAREEEIEKEIEPYRVLSRKLGERTWCLFWWQVGTFSAGVFFTVLSVLASVSRKLL
jgi:hypothetical protein